MLIFSVICTSSFYISSKQTKSHKQYTQQ